MKRFICIFYAIILSACASQGVISLDNESDSCLGYIPAPALKELNIDIALANSVVSHTAIGEFNIKYKDTLLMFRTP